MRIGVPLEIAPGETRVALVPEVAARLVKAGLEIVVESHAGERAGHADAAYVAAGLGKLFPLLMTAAGTIAPSPVFVLGAGVVGLLAIATARRLGAVVEAFDVRPAVREEVQSLGATFVQLDLTGEGESLVGAG